MCDFAYYNGEYTPYDSMRIPLTDKSLFFGEAVYDVIIGRNKIPYLLQEHLVRLRSCAQRLDISMSESDTFFEDIVNTLIKLSGYSDFIIYIQVSAYSDRRMHLSRSNKHNILITITSAVYPQFPAKISAITLPDLRYGYCDVKTVNLIPAVLSLKEAARQGAQIAIFEKNGMVTECSHANLAIIKDFSVLTPPLSSSVLPGITRKLLFRICEENKIRIFEKEITISELFDADAIIATSTTQFIRHCVNIDGTSVNSCCGEKLTHALFDLIYRDFISKTAF